MTHVVEPVRRECGLPAPPGPRSTAALGSGATASTPSVRRPAFTGESGLVDAQLAGVQQPQVRRHAIAFVEQHEVADHQIRRRHSRGHTAPRTAVASVRITAPSACSARPSCRNPATAFTTTRITHASTTSPHTGDRCGGEQHIDQREVQLQHQPARPALPQRPLRTVRHRSQCRPAAPPQAWSVLATSGVGSWNARPLPRTRPRRVQQPGCRRCPVAAR